MNDLIDLERFAGDDPVAAEAAFLRMTPKIERFLNRYLSQLLPSAEDREDVVSTTLARLWGRRTAFRVQGLGPWWAYVAKSGRRTALTKLGQNMPADKIEDDLPEDCPAVDTLSLYADDRRRLYQAADELWLKLDPNLSPIERKRRLLAAQLVFLHDVPPKVVRDYLGQAKHGREQVDEWLSSESTLLDLSYHFLFWENADLTWHLLGLPARNEPNGLDWWIAQVESRPQGNAPNGMSWNEVVVIFWRYYFAMSPERIVARSGDLDKAFVEDVLTRAEARIPHPELVRRLEAGFSTPWIGSKPLNNPGLWKRLVFQYCVHSGLPQKQIFQYTQPAAALVGHRITKAMLNAWLSNGRLFTQLASFAQEAKP